MTLRRADTSAHNAHGSSAFHSLKNDTPGFDVIIENLGFLSQELDTLLLETGEVIEGRLGPHHSSISRRENYINNLKSTIESRAFSLLGNQAHADANIALLRAVLVCGTNLERIGDFAVNIVKQVSFLHAPRLIHQAEATQLLGLVRSEILAIPDALFDPSVDTALKLCEIEKEADRVCAKTFHKIMGELRDGLEPEDRVASMFLFRYLERIGDSLQNIGEAILMAACGDRIKVSDFEALQTGLGAAPVRISADNFAYRGFWGTRSGSTIASVRPPGSDQKVGAPTPFDPDTRLIYKDGPSKKIQEEKEGIERWQDSFPSVPPRIYDQHVHNGRASLILEHIDGQTFQSILIQGSDIELARARQLLSTFLLSVWEQSAQTTQVGPEFVKQIQKRIPDIFRLHPEFQTPSCQIHTELTSSFENTLSAAKRLDEMLTASFSVLLHGDLNADNIMVTPGNQSIRFIDLHRAKMGNYVQDLSVFLISNFRLPIFERSVRKRIRETIFYFLDEASSFAKQHEDESFSARLALGLARSFLTSTRFSNHADFSHSMFMRGEFLLRDLLRHCGSTILDSNPPSPNTDFTNYTLNRDIFL